MLLPYDRKEDNNKDTNNSSCNKLVMAALIAKVYSAVITT